MNSYKHYFDVYLREVASVHDLSVIHPGIPGQRGSKESSRRRSLRKRKGMVILRYGVNNYEHDDYCLLQSTVREFYQERKKVQLF